MTDHAAVSITLANVDLTNCAQEPIHIPGFVQPHGVLLAFELDRTLSHRSANATELIPGLLAAEAVIAPGFWAQNHALSDAFEGVQEDAASGEDVPPFASELKIDGHLSPP